MDDGDQGDADKKHRIKDDNEDENKNKDEGMDLYDLQILLINTMHLAGCETRQIKGMIDERGGINKHIYGWSMHINEQQDMTDAKDINLILQHISELKPLLINIDACEDSGQVINRMIKRQNQHGRYFWINHNGGIKTNLTRGKLQTDDPDSFMIQSFVDALHESGRISINSIGSRAPETNHIFLDDLSGQELDPIMVTEARKEEMKEFEKHSVYQQVPIKECWDSTGKDPIGTRWVDINKGDLEHPEYRSRLVAQELNQSKRDDMFAATPPLEALRLVLSILASTRKQQHWKLDSIDIKRAYFHAKEQRDMYVRLPAGYHQDGMCGKLIKAMYGTRDAASIWEHA